MNPKRIAAGIFTAALAALTAWALITAVISQKLNTPKHSFGADAAERIDDPEDVLFDDDSTVDFSQPAQAAFDENSSAFESSAPTPQSGIFEFAVTPEYFNLLLKQYADSIPLHDATATFSSEALTVTGNVFPSELAQIADLPPAVILFLPQSVPCSLQCVPKAEDGALRVCVTQVNCANEAISSFLERGEILSAVENYINGLLEEHLPDFYKMEYTSLSAGGIYVRFRIDG